MLRETCALFGNTGPGKRHGKNTDGSWIRFGERNHRNRRDASRTIQEGQFHIERLKASPKFALSFSSDLVIEILLLRKGGNCYGNRRVPISRWPILRQGALLVSRWGECGGSGNHGLRPEDGRGNRLRPTTVGWQISNPGQALRRPWIGEMGGSNLRRCIGKGCGSQWGARG